MTGFPILSFLTFLPLIGALFILLLIRDREEETVIKNTKNCALWTSVLTFLFSLMLLKGFDAASTKYQFEEVVSWIPWLNISYHLGIDGISLFFILLTTLLTPLCILASWDSIKTRIREFMIAFLVLETLIIGVFCSLDLVLFYFFFEAMLIPMFLIIGIWGGANRVYAAYKFFLYTLAGSICMLLAIIYIYLQVGSMDILVLTSKLPHLAFPVQCWLFLAFLVSFAVKVPMWPVHTWLPDAHVQAPTAGSMILAGILLKVGGYGFLRFSLPFFPAASQYFADWLFAFSAIAVIYASLIALVQQDIKKLIAYSSVAHMGFVTVGIFTFNYYGIEGAIYQMLSHGVVSAALFFCVGVIYDRLHTREISHFGGIVEVMPKYALLMMLFSMASIGLPGTSGFVGEFVTILGVYQQSKLTAFLIGLGIVLGAGYMLWLYARVFFGEITNRDIKKLLDLDRREIAIFTPLAVLTLLMGIYPGFITHLLHVSVQQLVWHIEQSLKIQAIASMMPGVLN